MPSLRALIFDLDGTLTHFNIDMEGVKREIGLGEKRNILEFIEALPLPERERAEKVLREHEIRAAQRARVKEGVPELFSYLSGTKLKLALATRNHRRAVEIVSRRFGWRFDVVVTREDARPKPSKDSLDLALVRLGTGREKALFVGDHRYDLQAGKCAGIRTGLLRNSYSDEVLREADFVLDRMDDLIAVIEAVRGRRRGG
jgi:HAD superfamily hydrolase (TIGR01549 family)